MTIWSASIKTFLETEWRIGVGEEMESTFVIVL